MITPQSFIDGIAGLLESEFPNEKVYADLVPEDFERPGHEVECTSFTVVQADSGSLIARFELLVRTFVEVDEYHNSQYEALYIRAMRIMGLFAAGFIKISGTESGETRSPYVDNIACPVTGLDYAEVRISFSMQLDRGDFAAARNYPIMEKLVTAQTVTAN